MNKTPTLAYIKRQAKNFKRQKGISHTQALELIAKKFGYSNWVHCQRTISQQLIPETKQLVRYELSFTDWLKKHEKRDSPLGDLAKDVASDKTWPLLNTLEAYRIYLRSWNAIPPAIRALENAWKSYKAFLRRKNSPNATKSITNKTVTDKSNSRKIVFVKNVTPLHYSKRTIEKFNVGDKAWISWEGRKAIPVTIVEADEIYYTFRIERPAKKAGNEHYVRLDEVRSTPELACINHVTF